MGQVTNFTSDDCAGSTTPPKGNAVVYVVVNEDTLDETSDAATAQDKVQKIETLLTSIVGPTVLPCGYTATVDTLTFALRY